MKRSAIILVLATGLTGACSALGPTPQLRGNKVDVEQLKELVPGTSTRADVTSLIGSPTAKATFDDNTWIYISEVTQQRVGRVPGVNSQNVVTMRFDDKGILRDIKRLNEDDAKPVDMVARSTPSPGSEASFMQQLLGNVGRFTAGPTGTGSGPSIGAK